MPDYLERLAFKVGEGVFHQQGGLTLDAYPVEVALMHEFVGEQWRREGMAFDTPSTMPTALRTGRSTARPLAPRNYCITWAKLRIHSQRAKIVQAGSTRGARRFALPLRQRL